MERDVDPFERDGGNAALEVDGHREGAGSGDVGGDERVEVARGGDDGRSGGPSREVVQDRCQSREVTELIGEWSVCVLRLIGNAWRKLTCPAQTYCSPSMLKLTISRRALLSCIMIAVTRRSAASLKTD